MYFNYIQALKQMRERQKKDRVHFEMEGLSQEIIGDWFRFERRMLDRDTQFYLSLEHYMSPEAPFLVEQQYSLDVMDEIENERLYNALMQLKNEERELVFLHVVDGMPLKYIAVANYTLSAFTSAPNDLKYSKTSFSPCRYINLPPKI